MTELSQNERDERLARLAARGRVARPTTESHEPTNRRAAPASGRAKHPAGRSRLFTGIMSVALALGLVGGLTTAGHQAAQTAATPTQAVVVVPTAGASGSTTRSVATAPAATATPAPATTSGGS